MMTKSQENYLNMENAVIELFDKYPAVERNSPVLAQQVARLRAVRDETIEAAIKQRSNKSSGLTEEKNKARNDLENNLYLLSAKLRSFAAVNGRDADAALLRYSRSTLSTMKMNDLLTQARFAIGFAEPFLDVSGDYQITRETLDVLQRDVDNTAKLYAARDTAVDEGMEAGGRIAALIGKARKELKVLDDMVDGFADDRTFTASYYNSRRIHDIR